MTTAELRIRVRALAGRFSGVLEALADDLSRRAADPAARLSLTRLKINGIPAIQAALFEPDPIAALLDTWVLLVQLDDAIAKTEALQEDDLRARAHASIGELVA